MKVMRTTSKEFSKGRLKADPDFPAILATASVALEPTVAPLSCHIFGRN